MKYIITVIKCFMILNATTISGNVVNRTKFGDSYSLSLESTNHDGSSAETPTNMTETAEVQNKDLVKTTLLTTYNTSNVLPIKSFLITREKVAKFNTVITRNAIEPLSSYQPIIHLENKKGNNFMNYLLSLKAQKENKSKANSYETLVKINAEDESSFYLKPQQIRTIFKLAKIGETPLFRCQFPDASISIKCFSNIAKVTLASESEARFNSKLYMDGSEDEFILNSYKMNIFVVWIKRRGVVKPIMNHRLTSKIVDQKCNGCGPLETQLYLQEKDHACALPISCYGDRWSEQIVLGQNDGKSRSSSKYFIVALSLALHDVNDRKNMVVNRIKSNGSLELILKASSDSFLPGLHVEKCEVKNKSQSTIVLENGCSVRDTFQNFQIQENTTSEKVFVTTSQFAARTNDSQQQNLTIRCKVKVCKQHCNFNSSCQKGLIGKGEKSEVIADVSLEAPLIILSEKTESHYQNVTPNTLSRENTSPCNINNSMDKYECLAYVIFLSFIYLALLGGCVVYLTRKQEKQSWHKCRDEVESTPKMFYVENSSTRRRTPPNHNFSVLDYYD